MHSYRNKGSGRRDEWKTHGDMQAWYVIDWWPRIPQKTELKSVRQIPVSCKSIQVRRCMQQRPKLEAVDLESERRGWKKEASWRQSTSELVQSSGSTNPPILATCPEGVVLLFLLRNRPILRRNSSVNYTRLWMPGIETRVETPGW